MKFKLREFAYTRSDVIKKLQSNYEEYVNHLILLFLTRDSKTFNHWVHEVHNFYQKLPRTKNNGYLNEKTIYHNIFGNVEDIWDNIWITSLDWLDYKEVDYHIKDIVENGSKDMKDRCFTFIKNYTRWLAHELSTKGYVLYKEVEDKIKFELDIS